MDADYWRGRWDRGETGWHRAEVNPYLVRHWASAGVRSGGRVLVPLCGKTLDMGWLASQGHPVLGVEVSALAVHQFFEEAGLAAEARTTRVGRFDVTAAGDVAIACGDFFALEDLPLDDVAGLYDRASLIALPPPLRGRYAELLCRVLPAGVRGLSITLDYEQGLKAGPPFAVSAGEVHARFGGRFRVETRCNDDVLAHNPGFVAAGVPWLVEHAFTLTDTWPSP